VGEAGAELGFAALAPGGHGVQVRQHQPGAAAVREADIHESQDRQGEVVVSADELVGLGGAVGDRLLQRRGLKTDLAGGVGVLLVEEERLADQAPGTPGPPLNDCWMKP
jgi:hypothetical protein